MYFFLLLFIDLFRGDDFFYGLGIWIIRLIYLWKKMFFCIDIIGIERRGLCWYVV